jgi:hypothetical protein
MKSSTSRLSNSTRTASASSFRTAVSSKTKFVPKRLLNVRLSALPRLPAKRLPYRLLWKRPLSATSRLSLLSRKNSRSNFSMYNYKNGCTLAGAAVFS